MLKSTEELFQARMAMATTVSNETIVATMRGAKLKTDAKLKDFASIVMGVPNSGVKLDEYFRIIKPLLVEQTIEGVKRLVPVLIIENTAGEQRSIYASGLMRSTPTSSTPENAYDADVLNFDRGILQGTSGLTFPQAFEKLVGNGTDFLHVQDIVSWNLTGNLTVPNPTTGATTFTAQQKAYNLEFVSEADAKSATA